MHLNDDDSYFMNLNTQKNLCFFSPSNSSVGNDDIDKSDIVNKENYINELKREIEKQFIYENTDYDSKKIKDPIEDLQNFELNSNIINYNKNNSYLVSFPSLEIKKQNDNLEQKILGRKRKQSNEIGNHNKFSEDNLIKKCITTFFHILIICINGKIKKESNIGYIILNINQEQRINSNVDYYQNLLNKKIKDIFNDLKINKKYKLLKQDHNKTVIQKLLKEKDKTKREIFEKLFDLTFLDCLKHFRESEIKEELKEMKKLSEVLEEIKEEKYKKDFENTILNLEEIINKKNSRKRRKKYN